MSTSRIRKKGVRIIPFSATGYARYATAIGQLTLAWNGFHEALGHVFLVLCAGMIRDAENDTGPRYTAMWNSLSSDRQKRGLLAAVVDNPTDRMKRSHPKFLADFQWVLKQANVLEDVRNNAVHSPLILVTKDNPFSPRDIEHPYAIPDLILDNKRALQIAQKDLLTEFRWCRDMTESCRIFVIHMRRSMTGVGYPWPARPPVLKRGQRRVGRLVASPIVKL